MVSDSAILALGALAQGTRLDAFRLLVRHEPEGLAAGEVAKALDVPQNTMSVHLATLARAGLIRSERRGRIINYRADLDQLKALTLFLVKDCCGGKAELCAPLMLKAAMTVDIIIYHNPECGTSRNTLAMIRNAGIEPHVIEYLKTPPNRSRLVSLIGRMGITPRALLREKNTPYAELGLGDPALSDDQLIDAMIEHPILINRPIVVSPLGVKLCRPSEEVLDLLPARQRGAFTKEDGEKVIDDTGNRIGG